MSVVDVPQQVVTTTAEAIDLAAKLLWGFGVPHKIWQRGDFTPSWQEQTGNDGEMPDEVWEKVTDSYYHKHLSDCTEGDWYMVSEAVSEALA